MQYMLIYNEGPTAAAKRDNPAESGAYWGAWHAYIGAINAAGAFVSGNGLQPPHTATHVRIRDGQRHVQDGPFADVREHLAGYVVIEAASLDEALEWGARAPAAADGSVEVRPILPPPPAA